MSPQTFSAGAVGASGIPGQPGRPRHGGTTSSLIIGCLVIITAVIYYTRIKVDENTKAAARAVQDEQREPRSSLEEFFLQCTIDHRNNETACRVLLDFMSQDDRSWFERNFARMAEPNRPAPRSTDPASVDPDKQFAALRQLIQIVPQGRRPIIAQFQAKDDHAVAYVHEAGHAETMREVFLVREGGLWKIRRFLGQRDSVEILGPLVKAKQAAKEPLDGDEQQFAANPQLYAQQKRAEMLREVGLAK